MIAVITATSVGGFLTLEANSENPEIELEHHPEDFSVEEKWPPSKKNDKNEEEFVILDSMAEIEKKLKQKEDIQEGMVPVSLSIPSLSIEAPIISVGLLEDGSMEVPESTDEVGWYRHGAKIGEKGNAVLAGHVDSYKGPAIFFELKNIEIGAVINVIGENGEEKEFKVTKKETYKSNEAPIEEIFGESDSANLNLITCTGTFDYDSRHYLDRLVVYAELIEKDPAQKTINAPEAPTTVEFDTSSVSWHAVKDETIIGYRLYKKSVGKEEFTLLKSVSAHERKSFYDDKALVGDQYYITTVNLEYTESNPSETIIVK